jgi:hypothetical protein
VRTGKFRVAVFIIALGSVTLGATPAQAVPAGAEIPCATVTALGLVNGQFDKVAQLAIGQTGTLIAVSGSQGAAPIAKKLKSAHNASTRRAALSAALTWCQGGSASTAVTGTSTPPSVNTSGAASSAIGGTQTTPNGVKVTLHAFENPTQRVPSDSASHQVQGTNWAVLDDEVCAGSTKYFASPLDFTLADNQNRQYKIFDVTPEPFAPALDSTNLAPRECVRGLITYEVPPDLVVTGVRWSSQGDPSPLRWTI